MIDVLAFKGLSPVSGSFLSEDGQRQSSYVTEVSGYSRPLPWKGKQRKNWTRLALCGTPTDLLTNYYVNSFIDTLSAQTLFTTYSLVRSLHLARGCVHAKRSSPVGEYKKAYRSAKLVAPESAIQRHGDENLEFDGGGCFSPIIGVSHVFRSLGTRSA